VLAGRLDLDDAVRRGLTVQGRRQALERLRASAPAAA
jgi:hypothetical protein